MAVDTKIIEDVIVVNVHGNLMGGSETKECQEKVKSFISAGYKNLVLNLTHVHRVNSMGLGMLMACYNSFRNAGGHMKIAGAGEKVNSLLTMTHLITIFEMYHNADLAVQSFR
jgi:anti-sigma B factor antagonist